MAAMTSSAMMGSEGEIYAGLAKALDVSYSVPTSMTPVRLYPIASGYSATAYQEPVSNHSKSTIDVVIDVTCRLDGLHAHASLLAQAPL